MTFPCPHIPPLPSAIDLAYLVHAVSTTSTATIPACQDGDPPAVTIACTNASRKAVLAMEQVATVYYKHYWAAVHANELPAGVDYAVFDLAVNSGPSRAARFLQRVVGAAEDGRIGPATLAAVRKADPTDVIARLCDARLAWLKMLKTWPTFGRGWERRVTEVRHDAILDAADEAFAKAVVEEADTVDKVPGPAPTSDPQTPRHHQIGILAAAIIGAILMALSQLWNWITGG